VPVEAFDSAAPIRAEEAPERAWVFDRAASPSGYRTCYEETWPSQRLHILRPYDGSSFPRNFAPPRIRWEDLTSTAWRVEIQAPAWSEPVRATTSERFWQVDQATWDRIRSENLGEWVTVRVRGCVFEDGKRVGDAVYTDSVRIRISTYPADPLIVYRMVSPLFSPLKTPDIFYRHIESFDERMFLPGAKKYCTNCHSFPGAPDLQQEDLKLAIAVRSQLDRTDLKRILGLYDFEKREAKTLNINSFFMSWDPEGRNVAVTGGHQVKVRPLITLETQEFYVVTADILIVDASKEDLSEGTPLPGASTGEYMESFPSWSPDGKTICFARALEMPAAEFVERQFDLCLVPYNDGEGGEATLVPGGSQDGFSNFAGRFSPDGKWLAFTKCDYSSLVAPTSDLWIISTEPESIARPLECNYPFAMDSHHSWSSNSRWLLFASKRDDGIFATIYFTEIDEEGHASPPVELSVNRETMLCFNVPEFLKLDPGIDAWDILDKVSHLKQ